MKTNEYLKLLKKEISNSLTHCGHKIKLKEYNGVITVDITVTYGKPKPFMKSTFVYHDVISMPTEFTYGIARVQASLITNTMFGVMSTFFLS